MSHPHRRVRLAALFTLCALVAALGPAAARQDAGEPAESFGERVEVNVVNVDVVVTDGQGHLVTGLTRDDFTITEDGRPQEITNFYAIRSGQVLAGGDEGWSSIESGSPFHRRMVLLFDNNFLEKPDRRRALGAIHDFLDHKFDGSYEWSVVAVGDAVQVLQPFTSDKLRVRAALDRVASLPALGSRNRIDRQVLNDPVRTRISQRNASARGFDDSTLDLSNAMRFESRSNAARSLQAVVRTAAAMTQSFRAYGNLEGNKVLVLVTGGIPMLPEYGYQASDSEAIGVGDGRIAAATRDPQLYQLHRELREITDAVVTEANAAQFKVYSLKPGLEVDVPQLDPQHRTSGATYNASAFSAAPERDDNDSAQLALAAGTGALYLASNEPLEAVERIDAETSLYYSLGYSPAHAGDGLYHDIRVDVKRPGLRVRARRGYVDLTDEQRLRMALETPLSFPKDLGTLTLAVELAKGAKGEVTATAVMPMAELTLFPAGGTYRGRIHVFLAVYDRQGNLIDLNRDERDLSYGSDVIGQVLAQPLRYHLRFQLPTQRAYTVAVTVLDVTTQRHGTAFAEVEL
jgi:VWFA-related protein